MFEVSQVGQMCESCCSEELSTLNHTASSTLRNLIKNDYACINRMLVSFIHANPEEWRKIVYSWRSLDRFGKRLNGVFEAIIADIHT